jgi:hypothetical protein
MFDFSADPDLQGYDTCLFCLGVSSAGMSEADYTRLTFDLTMGWETLARTNSSMTFVYVSGAGTGGKAMWALREGAHRSGAARAVPRCVHDPPGHVAADAR